MKKNLLLVNLMTSFVLASATCFAQYDEPEVISHHPPKWVSKMGYWVVESNLNTPKHNIIYFYDNDNVLDYKETMDGVAVKLNKRRTKMRLKKLVDQTITAYEQKQMVVENERLVASVMR